MDLSTQPEPDTHRAETKTVERSLKPYLLHPLCHLIPNYTEILEKKNHTQREQRRRKINVKGNQSKRERERSKGKPRLNEIII